jgi:hypothetical protein
VAQAQSSSASAIETISFDFDFNTPGINGGIPTGISLNVGDILDSSSYIITHQPFDTDNVDGVQPMVIVYPANGNAQASTLKTPVVNPTPQQDGLLYIGSFSLGGMTVEATQALDLSLIVTLDQNQGNPNSTQGSATLYARIIRAT